MGLMDFYGGKSTPLQSSGSGAKDFKVTGGRDMFKKKLSREYLKNKVGPVRFGRGKNMEEVGASELGDKLYNEVVNKAAVPNRRGVIRRLMNLGVKEDYRKKIISAFRAKYGQTVSAGLSKQLQEEFKDVPEKFWPKNESIAAKKEAWMKYNRFKQRNIGYSKLQDERSREKEGKEALKNLLKTKDGTKWGANQIGSKTQTGSVSVFSHYPQPANQEKGSVASIGQQSVVPVGGVHTEPSGGDSNVIQGNFGADNQNNNTGKNASIDLPKAA